MVRINPNYRSLKSGETIRLLQYLKSIHQTGEFLRKNFINYTVFFESEHVRVAVKITKTNYMHLCGLFYERGARKFFDDALENKLSLKSIFIKKDGTTFWKLSVLGMVPQLFTEKLELTEHGNLVLLEFDQAIRTSSHRYEFALKNEGLVSYPVSLINLRIARHFPNGAKIIKIYSINKFNHQLKNIRN